MLSAQLCYEERDFDCVITGDDELDCEAAHLVPKVRDDVRRLGSQYSLQSADLCRCTELCWTYLYWRERPFTMSLLGYYCHEIYVIVMIDWSGHSITRSVSWYSQYLYEFSPLTFFEHERLELTMCIFSLRLSTQYITVKLSPSPRSESSSRISCPTPNYALGTTHNAHALTFEASLLWNRAVREMATTSGEGDATVLVG